MWERFAQPVEAKERQSDLRGIKREGKFTLRGLDTMRISCKRDSGKCPLIILDAIAFSLLAGSCKTITLRQREAVIWK
jgi:hypothetical protein